MPVFTALVDKLKLSFYLDAAIKVDNICEVCR